MTEPQNNVIYPRLVNRDGSFNIVRKGRQFRKFISNAYHTLLDLTWYKLMVIFSTYFFLVHFFFAILYFIGGPGSVQNAHHFWDFLFFSVQTMETIGYGYLYPVSFYANMIVFIQSWMGLLSNAVIAGVVFAKIARPSRMKKMILFSKVAVINHHSIRYFGSVDHLESGGYVGGGTAEECEILGSPEEVERISQDRDCPCLVFRMANLNKSQLCDTQFRLLLLQRRKTKAVTPQYTAAGRLKKLTWEERNQLSKTSETDDESYDEEEEEEEAKEHEEYFLTELNFELNRQVGRVRGLNSSVPLLGLPWTVIHPMDRHSPLHNATYESLLESRAEIIPVLDGINEAVSDTFQARFSYLASEIVWNARFVPIVCQRSGKFIVDYSKFHDIVPIISEISRSSIRLPSKQRSRSPSRRSVNPYYAVGNSNNNLRYSLRHSQRPHHTVNHGRPENQHLPVPSPLVRTSSSEVSEEEKKSTEDLFLLVPNVSHPSPVVAHASTGISHLSLGISPHSKGSIQ